MTRPWVCLLSLSLGLLSAASSQAVTRYAVPPGTPGVTSAAPYTTWATASSNLNVLRSGMSAGDTLIISNGVYYVTNQINPMCPGALIQGLTGNPDDVVITKDRSTYAGRFFWFDNGGWGERTTWVGLTFSNAFVSSGGYGSTFHLYGATNVTFRNCIFTDNVASNCGASALGSSGAGLQLSDCVFRNNRADNYYNCSAAALACSQLTMSNCTFIGNFGGGPHGGAVYITSGALTSVIDNCTFISNTITGCSYGGGGRNLSPLRMSRCTFAGNSNNASAGGGWDLGHANTVISDCLFSNNWASVGGGLSFRSTAGGVVSNCTIVNNRAGSGGGVSFSYGNNGLLVNCTLRGNTASEGGGLDTYPGAGEARNCLIVDNTAVNGGGIRISNVQGAAYTNRIVSCTIVGNTAVTHGGGIKLQSGYIGAYEVWNSIVYSNTSSSALTKDMQNAGTPLPASYFFNCTSSNFPSGNNITNAPRFVDYAGADYRLAAGSRCINAGTNMDWMLSAVDLDGKLRIQLGQVDIGAYEHNTSGTLILLK